MTFLHPWAIWIGVIAASVPVVVHLLTRPRPTRLPLSTVRFVREAVRQRRSRSRLRDLVILILRTAAILLLALTIARPQWGARPLVSDSRSGDATRVVLLDVSQSMGATQGNIEVLSRARPVAAGYLRYRPGLKANLVLAGARPRAVFEEPSANFSALADELAACRARPERIDTRRALAMAARMLAPTSPEDQRRRELVIVSDFQRSNWARADFSVLPEDTQIQLESVAPKQNMDNVAVTRVSATMLTAGEKGVQLEVDVVNNTPSARKVAVEVTVGDSTYRLSDTCPARRKTTLVERLDPRGAGWQDGEARLVGIEDTLSADNTRPLVVRIAPRPVYALITRQSPGRRPSSSHFLECALAPDKRLGDKASAKVVRINPGTMDHLALGPARLIVLDHPGKLDEEAVNLLAGLLRRGRPILYVASEPVDATNLAQLTKASGTSLRMPVEFSPAPAGQLRRHRFLASVRAEQAPFRVFGDHLATITEKLQFHGGLNSRRIEGALADDVLASFDDKSAALVLTSSDAGTLAVMNADLETSNLPRTRIFVPFMDELIGRMLNQRTADDAAECGEPLVVSLPPEADVAAGLKVFGPNANDKNTAATEPLGELLDQGAQVVWHWESPSRPGVYRIRRENQVVCSVPVVIPAEESRLESLSADVLTRRLAAGHDVYYHGADQADSRREQSWIYFAVACVICLLGELVALVVFKT